MHVPQFVTAMALCGMLAGVVGIVHEGRKYQQLQQEAVDEGHAHWYVDQSTGEKSFRWGEYGSNLTVKSKYPSDPALNIKVPPRRK